MFNSLFDRTSLNMKKVELKRISDPDIYYLKKV